jgi:hypothetical protein
MVAGSSQDCILFAFFARWRMLLRNWAWAAPVVAIETLDAGLGGAVFPVAYFSMHEIIKASASPSLLLLSASAFIFASTFFSTAAAIAFLSVDLMKVRDGEDA